MDILHLEGSRSTPEIFFDPASGILRMSGESFPENSFEFYKPVLSWLSRYLAVQTGPAFLKVHFSYLNTGSTKCLMDILDLLEEAFLKGKAVEVHWHYDADNDRALEAAEEFQEEVTLPFRIVAVSEAS